MARLLLLLIVAAAVYAAELKREIRLEPGVRATIVTPSLFNRRLPTELILYALPNGNTTEWTIGKTRSAGDDWHFDIQHIGAQTRALRAAMTGRNVVVAYLETEQKSWPAWRAANPDNGALILRIVEQIKKAVPKSKSLDLCLTGHSGGGSFTFGYIEAAPEIPRDIRRIAFLDSNYNYDAAQHAGKLVRWLGNDKQRRLVVIAYDDRNIMLNGKRVVSDTGGTYRATHRMVESMKLVEGQAGSYMRFAGPQTEMLVHRNPENKILHTTLVGEFNGYLHALTVGTQWEGKLGSLEGPRGYAQFIEGAKADPAPPPAIPPRPTNAPGGRAFIESLAGLDREAREKAVLVELMRGNIPSFLRQFVPIHVEATAVNGVRVSAIYEVMPDYIAIGSDEDYVRMPMEPHTAQAFGDAYGLALPTRKIVDDIWRAAVVKLTPEPMRQDRELPATFLRHHLLIEQQTHLPGSFVAGHKKDVVITNRLQERPNRLAIYGWHYLNGLPIQPLTIGHVDWYVDYSHGIRPVRRRILVDGKPLDYEEILRDPHLHVLLSDEGSIAKPRY